MIGVLAALGSVVLVTYLYRLWFNPNVPNGFRTVNALRAYNVVMKLIHLWCKFRCLFGGTYLEHLKSTYTSMQPPKTPAETQGISTRDTKFDGVDVRIYTNLDQKDPRPSIVFYHGGGWAMCNLDSYDVLCKKLIKALDVVVVSVAYRLADSSKGIKFPIPMQDCFVATKYLIENAGNYGCDSRRVVLMGDSAGGNLAAAVSLRLRDENFLPAPKLQILLYPALQCVSLSLPSYQQNKNGLFLSDWLMAQFWSLYVTGSDSGVRHLLENKCVPGQYKDILSANAIDRKYHYAPYRQYSPSSDGAGNLGKFAHIIQDPYCAPLMAESLAGLPEAYVFTAQHDVLRDDGLLYVKRLRDAGVKVTHQHSQIGFHGMLGLPSDAFPEPEFERCLQHITNYIKERV